MKNAREQTVAHAPQKAGAHLSVLMMLPAVVLGFLITGVVAIVVSSIWATSLTFYGFAVLWLVLACAILFAGQQMLRRKIGVWAYLLTSTLVIVLVFLLGITQYLLILL